MGGLVRGVDALARGLALVAMALAGLMMVHVTLDVILGQFIAEPLPGTVDYVSYYYMVGLVFLPLAFVESKNEHIRVDLVHDALPPRGRMALDMLALALSAVYFSLLTYRTWLDAIEKYAIGEYSIGIVRVTIWPGRFFLPIGAGVLTLMLILKLVRRPFTDADMAIEQHDMTGGEGQ